WSGRRPPGPTPRGAPGRSPPGRRPRSQERPHLALPVAGLRPLGGELERHVEVGGLDDPEADEILLRLHEGPVAEHRLLASVVDNRGRAGRPEATGEDPVTLRHEPVVEHVDGRLLLRGAGVVLFVDHGTRVLHLVSSPVVRSAPRGQPLTPATNASAPIRHRLADLFRGLWYAGGERSGSSKSSLDTCAGASPNITCLGSARPLHTAG